MDHYLLRILTWATVAAAVASSLLIAATGHGNPMPEPDQTGATALRSHASVEQRVDPSRAGTASAPGRAATTR